MGAKEIKKGRIAIIPGCQHCPYKAFDIFLGLIRNDDRTYTETDSTICYCGYHLGKDSLDNDNRHWLIIEPYLRPIGDDYIRLSEKYPTEWGKQMPDLCPLPYGTDVKQEDRTSCAQESGL